MNCYLSKLLGTEMYILDPGGEYERGSNGLHQVPKKITNDTTMINIWQSSNKDGLVWLRNVRNPFITSQHFPGFVRTRCQEVRTRWQRSGFSDNISTLCMQTDSKKLDYLPNFLFW